MVARFFILFVLLAGPVAAQTLLGVGSQMQAPAAPAPPAGPTACERFIEKLVAMADTPWWMPRIAKELQVGTSMVLEARRMLAPDAAGRPAEERPVDGFRPALVANGQNGEVYRHLLGHGGAMLLGPLGWLMSAKEVAKDRRQATVGDDEEGPAEASTELVDDAAGRAVGVLMSLRIRGLLTEDGLRSRLRKLLHQ
jgi:hypothetical protein